jgi:hypothetical protein
LLGEGGGKRKRERGGREGGRDKRGSGETLSKIKNKRRRTPWIENMMYSIF